MGGSAPAIRTVDLGRYPAGKGPAHVLAGVDLELAPGRCLGILGGNGAGKSTFFRLLAGLAPIGRGAAWLHGVPVPEPASRIGFGYLPEQPAVLEYLTGAESLRLFGELEGLGGAALEAAVARGLEEFGLARHGGALAGRYSKGMVQKLELARLFLTPKRLLLLDEPMTGLDSEAQSRLLDRLVRFKAEGGTLVLTAHEGELVELVCDELAVLDQGRLVRRGTLRELLTATGWSIELAPDPPPGGATGEAPGGRRLDYPDREAGQRALAELLAGGARVVSFGPRILRLHELLRNLGTHSAGAGEEGRDG